MKTLFSACLLAALAACTASAPQQNAPVQVSTSATGIVTGFTTDLNAFRSSQGLSPLRPNAALTRAAQAHAEDMARRGYFSHRSVGGPNGTTFSERARAGGCALRSGAENIASGQRSEAAALEAPQHAAPELYAIRAWPVREHLGAETCCQLLTALLFARDPDIPDRTIIPHHDGGKNCVPNIGRATCTLCDRRSGVQVQHSDICHRTHAKSPNLA